MNDEKKVTDAIKEIDKLVDEGVLQNLSNEQLDELAKLIDEIKKI